MRRNQLLSLSRQLLGQPTAPYHEEAVAQFIREFALARGLPVRTDKFGNLQGTAGYIAGGGVVIIKAHKIANGAGVIHADGNGFGRLFLRFDAVSQAQTARDYFDIYRHFSLSLEHSHQHCIYDAEHQC